jgi:hypothetical protein
MRFGKSRSEGYSRFDLSKSNIRIVLISDAELAGLIQYLRSIQTRSGGQQVVRILEVMQELENLDEPGWGDCKEERDFVSGPNARSFTATRRGMTGPHPLLRNIAPDKYRRQLDIDQKKFFLNREFARTRFIPMVWRVGAQAQWFVMWRSKPHRPKKFRGGRGPVELDNGGALQAILTLARAGYLNRLRRCTCCQRWIYARFKHQNFCSTKCQQKHYARSEEWKAKRRRYMRQYRQYAD